MRRSRIQADHLSEMSDEEALSKSFVLNRSLTPKFLKRKTLVERDNFGPSVHHQARQIENVSEVTDKRIPDFKVLMLRMKPLKKILREDHLPYQKYSPKNLVNDFPENHPLSKILIGIQLSDKEFTRGYKEKESITSSINSPLLRKGRILRSSISIKCRETTAPHIRPPIKSILSILKKRTKMDQKGQGLLKKLNLSLNTVRFA